MLKEVNGGTQTDPEVGTRAEPLITQIRDEDQEQDGQHSSRRVYPNNPCWVLCCCGCLPVVGLIKGLVFGSPAVLILGVSFTGISYICMPHILYLVYKVLFTNVGIGPNLRLLSALLFVPALVVAYLVVVPIIIFVAAFLFCIGSMMVGVFDDNVNLWVGGVGNLYLDVIPNAIKSYWKLQSRDVFLAADDLVYIPRGWQGEVYDIPLSKVFIGLALLAWGSAYGTIFALLVALLRLIPGILAVNKEYLKSHPNLGQCHYWPFFWIGFLVMNGLGAPLFVAFCGLYGVAMGIIAARHALETDSVTSGFFEPMRCVRELDVWLNDKLRESLCDDDRCWKSGSSYFPALPPRPQDASIGSVDDPNEAQNDAADTTADGRYTVTSLVRSFSSALRAALYESLERKWTDSSAVVNLEPAILVGLPALAAFDVLRVSAISLPASNAFSCLTAALARQDRLHGPKPKEQAGVEVARPETGAQPPASPVPAVITEANLPAHHAMVRLLWPKFVSCKALLEDAKLDDGEIEYVRIKLVAGGGVISDVKVQAAVLRFESEGRNLTRTKQISAVVSAVNSIAFDLSRLGQVMKACGDLLQEFSSSPAASPHDATD